jgi:toxin ParE1/3/4
MKFSVYLVEDAEKDLLDIYRYVAQYDSVGHADSLIGKLEKTILRLEAMPHRGHVPPELERIGVFDYREIFYKPYRIIYQVIKSTVYIYSILDGRRDLQDLLQQRVLR